MEKQKSTKGFALLEILIVLMIISTIIITTPHVFNLSFKSRELISQYSYQQFIAIKNIEKRCFQFTSLYSNYPITFNKKGNINISQTIIFQIDNNKQQFVVYLGGGRIAPK